MTTRRWARPLAGLLSVAWLTGLVGCASLFDRTAADQPGQAASAPSSSASAAAAPPADAASASATVSYRVQVRAPDELRDLLLANLDLARFQNAPQTDGITNPELVRLAAASPAQARSLLETQGYFNAQVTVQREDPADETPLVTLTVTPGPRTQITSWQLVAVGGLQERIEAGEKEAIDLLESLRRRWPLKDGQPFSQSAWSSAKNGTLAQLRAEGYPTATLSNKTLAHVDAKTHQAGLFVELDSGPLFLLGELKIEGLKRYNEEGIRNVADFTPGMPYTEKRLFDYQERLGKLGLFSGVTVEIEPDPAKADAVPVIVRVTEQKLQQAVAGVGFSDNTRERFTLEHRHLRPFGLQAQANNKLELGRNLRSWEGELLGDPGEEQYRRLLAGSITRLDTVDDVTTSWRVRAGRTLYTERIERLIFGELLSANLKNGLGETTNQALSANYNWIWRDIDNIILPTRGLTSAIQGAVGFARSNNADNGPFTRLYTRNTLYWPLGGSWFTQTRVEFGEVFTKDTVGIPDPLLFRAGGDDSVRGYGYRELGPRINGVLTSGRKLLTGSAEIARPISAKQPAIWGAVFVDAGNATNDWKDYKPAFGYGVGVRWRSPVGPLRIDWAYGRDVKKSRLHFSVGIAF